MLSMRDLVDYCDLDQGEIEAIAEHEHVPLAVAAEISELLLCTPEGVCALHQMLIDNMQHALEAGRMAHVAELTEIYAHLCRLHPLPSDSKH